MKIRVTHFFPAALLILLATTSVHAQQNVVVVDMSKVFQKHQGFKDSINNLQKEVEQFKQVIQGDRTKIKTQSETLAGLERSSAEFKTKEAEIAKMAADMQVNHNIKNKDFMEREAKLYYQTYVQILTAVQNFSRENNITLVIRFSGEEMDPTNRASVLAGVNNVVVYQEKRDITDLIIQMVNGPSVANQNTGNVQR